MVFSAVLRQLTELCFVYMCVIIITKSEFLNVETVQ